MWTAIKKLLPNTSLYAFAREKHTTFTESESESESSESSDSDHVCQQYDIPDLSFKHNTTAI